MAETCTTCKIVKMQNRKETCNFEIIAKWQLLQYCSMCTSGWQVLLAISAIRPKWTLLPARRDRSRTTEASFTRVSSQVPTPLPLGHLCESNFCHSASRAAFAAGMFYCERGTFFATIAGYKHKAENVWNTCSRCPSVSRHVLGTVGAAAAWWALHSSSVMILAISKVALC